MSDVEIWLDVELVNEPVAHHVLTLFARHELASIPRQGETIMYMQAKGSSHQFNLVGSLGALPETTFSTTVAEITYYACGETQPISYKASMRLEAVVAASLDDARELVAFLTSQLGFEPDPYGANKLIGAGDAGGA